MSWIDKKEKREQVANLYEKSKAIVLKAKEEKREFTAEENVEIEKIHVDSEKLNNEIRTLENQEKLEKSVEERIGRENFEVEKPEAKNDDLQNRAFDKFLRFQKMNDEEKRALSAGTSTEGADFVPQSFWNSFYEVLKDYSGVREVATVIPTSNGQLLPLPKVNDTANTGELIGENTAANDAGADPDTATLNMNAYQYSSKIVKVSEALVQDSAFDVQSWLPPLLATRIGRIQNTHFSVGDGSDKPQGIVNGSSLGKTAAAEAAITYVEVLDLIHSMDHAYRKNCKLMFNDATFLYLKKLLDGDNNFLFNYGNAAAGFPSTIHGFEYVINNDMANIGTSAKPILFGDFKKGYVIRDVQSVNVKVMDQLYGNVFQVGYVAGVRSDGGVIDSTCIKHMIMNAGD